MLSKRALVNNTSKLLSQPRRGFMLLNKAKSMNQASTMKNTSFYQVMAMRMFASLPDHIKLTMPNLSPTMEVGKIESWNAKVGDLLVPGDILASVATDKATVDFEMQEEGYVAALLVEEGTENIEVGKLVAIMVEEEEDIAAFKDYVVSEETETKAAAPAAEEKSASVASTPVA